MSKITLLLVDDHQLLLDAWAMLLNSDGRFHVMGNTNEGEHALALAKLCRPDIVLCDINMSPMNGFELTKKIRLISPSSKVIGVSLHNIPAYAKKMMKAGARGYVTKNSSAEELKLAILEVYTGKLYMCEEIKNKLVQKGNGIDQLTRKELEVISSVKEGLSSKEIALKLQMSLKTVEVHRYNILRKLDLKNTAALVNFINLRGM